MLARAPDNGGGREGKSLFFEGMATNRFPRLQSVAPHTHLGSTNWTQRVIKTTAKDIKAEGGTLGNHGVN